MLLCGGPFRVRVYGGGAFHLFSKSRKTKMEIRKFYGRLQTSKKIAPSQRERVGLPANARQAGVRGFINDC